MSKLTETLIIYIAIGCVGSVIYFDLKLNRMTQDIQQQIDSILVTKASELDRGDAAGQSGIPCDSADPSQAVEQGNAPQVVEEEDRFIAQTEAIFLKQEVDPKWSKNMESYVLEKMSEEVLSQYSSGKNIKAIEARLKTFACRQTICEMTVQSDNWTEMIRYKKIMAKRLAAELPAIRFGTPIESGSGYYAKIYFARDKANFN